MEKRILETVNLYLENLTEKHKNGLFSLLANEKVQMHFPKTLSPQESEEFYQKVQNKYEEDGFSFWAVMRKENDQFIGICGILKQIIEEIEEFEVGYRILDKYWGNGYATEAARGCILYGKDKLGKESIVATIRPLNIQSIRVAEKNEMTYEKDVIFHDLQHRLYRKKFY